MMYKILVKPILFLFNPEFIHHLIFRIIKIASYIPLKLTFWNKIYRVNDEKLKRELFGLTFDNPVGLAAGFDKDAKLFDELACIIPPFIKTKSCTTN